MNIPKQDYPVHRQTPLFKLDGDPIDQNYRGYHVVAPFRTQLLKWIGNKQRFAHEIISYFPESYKKYYEPFLRSGAVLGTLAPEHAVASDGLKPLIEIWQTLSANPRLVKEWYGNDGLYMTATTCKIREIRRRNAAERCRSSFYIALCYGSVVRFRSDGYISACGASADQPGRL
jgi:DNA adenine methylase